MHSDFYLYVHKYVVSVVSLYSASTSPQSKGVVCLADARSYVLKNVYKRVLCTYV